MPPDFVLALLFMLIAFVYASVGLGGGSSYLALMAFAGIPFQEMRLTALICNIVVVTGGTLVYYKHQQLEWRKILPLVALSIPASFIGAQLRISQHQFFVLLGVSLIVAALLLWFQPQPRFDGIVRRPNPVRDGVLGGGIGLLSGMVGIGGGIFLSPLLQLLQWDNARKIAAAASFLILVNSIAGLTGQLMQNVDLQEFGRISTLVVAVLIGGQIGSRTSMKHFDLHVIRRVTALVVLAAGLEVLHKHW